MRKKYLIFPIIAIIFSVGAFIIHPVLRAQEQEKGQEQYKLEARTGNVTFAHWKHQTELKIDCVTCHHKAEPDATPEACSSCHKRDVKDVTEGEPPAMKTAAHNQCRKCHKEKVETGAKPPTKCKECHIKETI